eukprot:TRINITY_DN17988_c0_g1_i1.p2 TRINITY_DN17988_c0_g1~~TRINITY_DN17988_c0_g1_i1.p2  ORF type:complete len:163 (+),score=35.72 TRINITY_DN17988_c0_g1_i1:241-729(+)
MGRHTCKASPAKKVMVKKNGGGKANWGKPSPEDEILPENYDDPNYDPSEEKVKFEVVRFRDPADEKAEAEERREQDENLLLKVTNKLEELLHMVEGSRFSLLEDELTTALATANREKEDLWEEEKEDVGSDSEDDGEEDEEEDAQICGLKTGGSMQNRPLVT